MPKFTRLTEEQVDALQPKRAKGVASQRKAIADSYRENLKSFQRGEWVEVTLDPGDKRDTVKNRLKSAAGALGVELDFKRTRGDKLRFQIK